MVNISFYGSHNATFVVEEYGKILLVLELERFLNYKNSGLAQYKCPKYQDIVFLSKFVPEFIKKYLNIKNFKTCYYLNTDVITDQHHNLEQNIPAKFFKHVKHHEAHAAGAFYQSSFQEALVFSFDGGGNDGKFNIYLAKRETSVELLESVINPVLQNAHILYDLGFPYMVFAHYLKDIKFECLGDGNLVYPGKIMGLASYGNVIEEWLPDFIEFYKQNPDGINYQEVIDTLGEKINVKFDTDNRLEGQLAWDVAATNQRAFEECFLEIAKPYMTEYPDLPLCITGGCGLNIILNTRLKEEFKREVFVPPNPNDCGIALGILLHELKPEEAVDATYSGTTLLDYNNIGNYIQNQPFSFSSHFLDVEDLVQDLIDGKIVGVARGRSEHGPRALGNRSIICDPSFEGMKDILNEKVKHREWYRPFAPVVRLEDVNTYFEWEGESRWMTFCPRVREEWKAKLSAITHVDGTARVQTVTKEQNPWLYELLTLFKDKRGVGVLLNTSFNVDGKPILSTVDDAFKIFRESQMDRLVIEDLYFKK
jgi:carbamoyltransferase